ncbi:DNA polymerase epsilon noncatalytic subunit Ecym_2806 [Eremothecium cymbalariae DBVPG|uniref:DNA polymerase epsilon subunit B n=1 Tax=Eremothecium cymbalariae (strain CBS 270.75 / DBVPG 7215 / KCTC 17166 / NRRL Y-17582) TaxID=931890 RepID=G8JQE0_ERECY|nr:Hypothetical protein Ecym_2806 [Eremothecium cymbalariae DBVPG\
MDKGSTLPVEISPQLLRPLAYRLLSKKYGLNIKSDGLASLAKFIGSTFGMTWKRSPESLKFLEKFATVWREQERGLFVDAQGVEEVIKELIERNKAAQEQRRLCVKSVVAPESVKPKTLDAFLKSKPKNASAEDVDIVSVREDTQPDLQPVKDITGDVVMDLSDDANYSAENDASAASNDELNWSDYFKIINSFSQQRFTYDAVKKRFRFVRPKEMQNLKSSFISKLKIPTVESGIPLFSTRYHLVKERVLRNENFQNGDTYNPLSSMAQLENQLKGSNLNLGSSVYMSITQIKNLLGRDGKNFLLLGVLRKNSKGVWLLEDPSGQVDLDISEAIPTKGSYYVPGCILLAEGIYSRNMFHVSSITHPPGERREVTLDAIGNLDMLGIHELSSEHYIARLDRDLKIRLHYLEKELTDHRFVLLGGNIFLDEVNTFDALTKVFKVLNADPPTVIVLNGSFNSTPLHPSMTSKNISSTTTYKNNFDALASLLSNYERLINECTFIFIPGPNDPWSSMVTSGVPGLLPQKEIPINFVSRVNRICRHVFWGSTPTRVAYLSQEILLTRDDICTRFKRNNVIFPITEAEKMEQYLTLQKELQDEDHDPDLSISQLIKSRDQLPASVQESRKIVKTLLDQQHLSPFISQIRPTIWDLDHTLHLLPIPSTLVICDVTTCQYDVTYNGCKTINPGVFIHRRTAHYVEFIPSLRKTIKEEVPF